MKKKQITSLILLFGYTLGVWRGYVALWKAHDSKPIRIFPCSVASLPPADQQALSKGIRTDSHTDLLLLLEDYLS